MIWIRVNGGQWSVILCHGTKSESKRKLHICLHNHWPSNHCDMSKNGVVVCVEYESEAVIKQKCQRIGFLTVRRNITQTHAHTGKSDESPSFCCRHYCPTFQCRTHFYNHFPYLRGDKVTIRWRGRVKPLPPPLEEITTNVRFSFATTIILLNTFYGFTHI